MYLAILPSLLGAEIYPSVCMSIQQNTLVCISKHHVDMRRKAD